ncbi:MAG: Uma2 family endonuclease [Chloroflexi bacterium]|nr:Uma2 family endonuclease [Chloroflexota bacterium]
MVSNPRVRLTVQDYLDIPEEDENRYELIDGELYMAPAPSWEHQSNSHNLTLLLSNFVSAGNLGVIRYSPLDVYLSDEDVFQPDIVFISNERLDIIRPDGLHGAPDLVIEILSPCTEQRDLTVKRERYEMFNTREYWLANPIAKTITVLRMQNGTFEQMGVFTEGMILETPLLPGLQVDISTVFDYYVPQEA